MQIETIHNTIFTGVVTLYLFQAIILFVRSKKNKVRKTMAIIELLWGIEYALTLILMNTIITNEEYSILREKVLIVGNFYITFTHFFPIQVLVPGWLNWKHIGLMTLPIILLTITYYAGMYLLGETPEYLYSYATLWDSIGHFNVWFRFVILFSNILYIVIILIWLYRFEKQYIQWKNDNYADQEYVDIAWMRSYDYIIIGIFLFYLGILFIGGRIPVMIHSTFAVICFSYLFYKALFYESPYPEDFYGNSSTATPSDTADGFDLCNSKTTEYLNECTFENRITTYVEKLKRWMEEEKPYLFYDFKLTDVARILPLNRSYLSRVFNEGFGKNFSEVVRSYRIEYSKDILKNNPTMPMHKVASLSGFRSDSTYTKAFKQIMNMTPTQYKAYRHEKL